MVTVIRLHARGPMVRRPSIAASCLFRSDLHGSLVEMDEKLEGLLVHIRASSPPKGAQFRGELGETLLIAPRAGSLAARRLLIVGLGDSGTFTPARMNLVGAIVFSETCCADRS
jgi:hypothetical protein